jgi:hypothetical protein
MTDISSSSAFGVDPKETDSMPLFKTTDIHILADRPYSRGVSRMLDDSPSMQADLRTASRVLRALLGNIDAVAAKTNETAQLLAEMRIELED